MTFVREDFNNDSTTTKPMLTKRISGTHLDTKLTLPCCKNQRVLCECLR